MTLDLKQKQGEDGRGDFFSDESPEFNFGYNQLPYKENQRCDKSFGGRTNQRHDTRCWFTANIWNSFWILFGFSLDSFWILFGFFLDFLSFDWFIIICAGYSKRRPP